MLPWRAIFMKAFLVPGVTYTLDTDEWQGGGHEAGAGGLGGAGGGGGRRGENESLSKKWRIWELLTENITECFKKNARQFLGIGKMVCKKNQKLPDFQDITDLFLFSSNFFSPIALIPRCFLERSPTLLTQRPLLKEVPLLSICHRGKKDNTQAWISSQSSSELSVTISLCPGLCLQSGRPAAWLQQAV